MTSVSRCAGHVPLGEAAFRGVPREHLRHRKAGRRWSSGEAVLPDRTRGGGVDPGRPVRPRRRDPGRGLGGRISPDPPQETLADIAAEYGRRVGGRRGNTTVTVGRWPRCNMVGYEPELRRRWSFATARFARRPENPEMICRMNVAFVGGLLEGTQSPTLHAVLSPSSRAVLRRRHPIASSRLRRPPRHVRCRSPARSTASLASNNTNEYSRYCEVGSGVPAWDVPPDPRRSGATLAAILIGIVVTLDFPSGLIVWVIFSVIYQPLENNLLPAVRVPAHGGAAPAARDRRDPRRGKRAGRARRAARDPDRGRGADRGEGLVGAAQAAAVAAASRTSRPAHPGPAFPSPPAKRAPGRIMLLAFAVGRRSAQAGGALMKDSRLSESRVAWPGLGSPTRYSVRSCNEGTDPGVNGTVSHPAMDRRPDPSLMRNARGRTGGC